jgi:hypothetical protein
MDKVEIRQPQPAKAAPSNLPKTPEDRAVVLIDLIERLTSHLANETNAIEQRRNGDLGDLVTAKQPMSLVTEEMARLLRIDRDGMSALPLDLKERLRDAVRALQSTVECNVATIQRAAGAQKILVDTVVGAVNRERRLSHPAYGPMAAGQRPNSPSRAFGPPKSGPATAATLNTRL